MPAKTTNIQRYAVFLFLFFAFLVSFIFASYYIHVSINRWTLIAAFSCYSFIWLLIYRYFNIRIAESYRELSVFILITPFILLGGSNLFGRTYDTSYDGLFEHQPAILALASGWNPIYQPRLPLTNPQPPSSSFIEGSPKAVWAIEASIYRLTGSMDGATVLNALVAFIALAFVIAGLRELRIGPRLTANMSLLVILTPLFLDQLVTLREDNLSYDCLLIGLVSLLFIIKKRRSFVIYSCFLSALLLLASSKFSNIYILLALLGLGIYAFIHSKLWQLRPIQLLTIGFTLICLLVLFNPLFTNRFVFHSLVFPYNQTTNAESFRDRGVPVNIRYDNKPVLFFYGVFARSEVSYDNNKTDYARLKVPFTFSRQELMLDALNTSKLVGGYGVLFGGLMVITIGAYIYLTFKAREVSDRYIMRWLHIGITLTLLSCLIITIPNYARYNGQLFLMPIIVMCGLILTSIHKAMASKLFLASLMFLIAGNFCVVAVPAIKDQIKSDNTINFELAALKHSHSTYSVYSGTFYASYEILRSHGVPISISNKPLQCPVELDIYFPPSTPSTQLCPLKQRG